MKIIHISHSDGRSGAGIAAKRIHEALENNKENYKSLLLVNRNFNSDLKIIKKRNLMDKFFIISKLYIERFLIKLLNHSNFLRPLPRKNYRKHLFNSFFLSCNKSIIIVYQLFLYKINNESIRTYNYS